EDGVTEISDATDDQATSTEEVVAMVDEVSSVAEETAAEASNVSAASEEQTSSLTDVGENVENLSKVAEELHELVEQFDVKQTGIESATPEQELAQNPAATDGGTGIDTSKNVMDRQGTE
ncbi:MAG: chemotaxis protein, partial [Halobacteriaceae archaeon]